MIIMLANMMNKSMQRQSQEEAHRRITPEAGFLTGPARLRGSGGQAEKAMKAD